MNDGFEMFGIPGETVANDVPINNQPETPNRTKMRMKLPAEGAGLRVLSVAKFVLILSIFVVLFSSAYSYIGLISNDNFTTSFIDGGRALAMLIVVLQLIFGLLSSWIIYVLISGFGELVNNSELLVRMKEQE